MENPIKMDDLGVPLFLETPINSGARHWIFGLSILLRCERRGVPNGFCPVALH